MRARVQKRYQTHQRTASPLASTLACYKLCFVQTSFLMRWAELICDYCFEIKAGQTLLLQTTTEALPLLRAVHNALLEREAFPVLKLQYPEQLEDMYLHAKDAQLEHLAMADIEQMRHIDAFLRIEAPNGVDRAGTSDPARAMRYRRALAQLNEVRANKPWCITLYPTVGAAQTANMTLPEFEDFVARAMFLHLDNPVQGWLEIRELQAKLIERLQRAKIIRLETERSDVTLSVEGRTWRNSDGKRNMPSGEVFTSPIETSANGIAHFDVPTISSGFPVSGVTLEFKDGQVISAKAEDGDAYLQQALKIDAGARFLGEIGIGTNRGITRATRNILFDEKIGGTAHLAIGKSYTECGGTNQSALHWDLIMDLRQSGRIWVDNEIFQENGVFV
jgi:aminopeptidase